ncbi:MAG: gamma-glutamyltranspeptidase/glutathione hydrolase [Flavobacteriaceae bacterium]|jgi:gamma-glutamyltranspeptidase/glutathione hydrolase
MIRYKRKLFNGSLLLFTALLYSCTQERSAKAAVVSARVEASKIGVGIIASGGSAFDAMIATDLALAVCYPNAGNIAGGGFLVYRTASGEVGSLDYREKAPLKAFDDMYLDEEGNVIPNKSTLGGLSVGVPGTVAGMFAVHQKFGSLPWNELVQPAIDLARNGYRVTEKQYHSLKSKQKNFIAMNGVETFYAQEFTVGDLVKNEALAKTLEYIALNGKDGFYRGPVADALVARVKETGGIINHEDLESYQPVWRKPVSFKYKNLKIHTMAPPSSGGICLGQIMKMIEPFDVGQYAHNSQKAIQVIVEAERRSYADRSFYLGDPDFVKIPQDSLLAADYLSERMNSFSFNKATKSSDISPGSVLWEESEETTHYSIIDQMGNAVAVTTTLNGSYGSKIFVQEGGYFLNNEMDDFSSKPGVPNMFGLLGGKANAIAPQKRMLSAMTPTIVERNGKLAMIVGTPGGSTIITSVLQTLLNVYEFEMDIQEAVSAPRFHHQWLPDIVIFEPSGFSTALIEKLQAKGYKIKEEYTRIIGRVDAILISESNQISTGADPRGDDTAVHLY